ncbi:MAG: hypothetical protein LBC89_00960 [Bacteroidales bacterium]|jgi:hypothetical protein|nr:hypothetical protein [Bacteroidales bacterium]
MAQPERVSFLGLSLFLEQKTFDGTQFKQWMRIVWNVVENTDIDGFQPMYSAMELINELSSNSTDIYAFLADAANSLTAQSSANAIKEERQKATFIQQNINWEQTFIEAEKHPFFKGSVGFIISDPMTEDGFKHRTEMANKVFANKVINEKYCNNGHLFLRALISKYNQHNQLINRNFTDIDEKEHFLKKMLA